ncbi:aldose 1-epimerase family protein, partial [Fusobacterium mortiferum]|nr:aldose 1-epimerase family protein [Fusobacterium mortiferum]
VDTHGAEIHSLVLKETGDEYIWQADARYWQRHAPVLFPFVGKLKNGQYEYDGSVYNMTGHGFARDMDFTLIEQTDSSLTYELSYT